MSVLCLRLPQQSVRPRLASVSPTVDWVTEFASSPNGGVRTAEVIAAVSLATDLGMGFPFEHGLHVTLMSMRICDLLDVDTDTASQTYYASMLMYMGCTTDAQKNAEVFAGSRTEHLTPTTWGSFGERLGGVVRALPPADTARLWWTVEVARRLPKMMVAARGHFTALCEVAEMLCQRLGLPAEVHGLFPFLTERWDGTSILRRAQGEDIPLPLRIVHVAHDAAYQRYIGGEHHAREVIADRAGHAFDPRIAAGFVGEADEVFAAADAGHMAWDQVLAVEPHPWLMLEGEAIDRALSAIGDFADLVSPSLSGHSAGLAKLVTKTAELVRLEDDERETLRRAALVHDVGRVGIDPRVWDKRGALTADEQEQVRLHPYHTERVLIRSPFLEALAHVACDHHERMDGTGYHRGVPAASLSRPARLLAAADAFHAMTEPRPYRQPMVTDEAARVLANDAGEGRFDPELTEAVIEAAGASPPEIERPAGLTQREAEVIGLIARGLQTKQVARQLDISPKTADAHLQNAYRKIGVSTRAAATLFAMEHGLVA